MKYILSVALFSTLFFFSFPLSGQIRQPDCHEIILQLYNGVSPETMVRQLNQSSGLGWSAERQLSKRFNAWLFSFEKTGEGATAMNAVKMLPEVQSASWNLPLEFRDSIPNDSLFGEQWNMEILGLPKVWDVTTGGATANGDEIVVAVMDSGIDLNHDDLRDNLWHNPNEIPGDSDDNDDNGYPDDIHGWNFEQGGSPYFFFDDHGTKVTGILAATGNNQEGIAGVNWKVKYMFIEVLKDAEVIEGFEYILEMRKRYNESNGAEGTFIVATNSSFGHDGKTCDEYPLWAAYYDLLGAEGILNAAATTNDLVDVEEVGDMPTDCTSEFMIAVTSTDRNDRLGETGYGKISIDLGAPGVNPLSTDTQNRYSDVLNGTSFAVPHVTGAIALLYSLPCSDIADLAKADPPAAARLVRDAIFDGVDVNPDLKDKMVTGGRMNVFKAMQYLHSYCIADPEIREAGTYDEKYIAEKNFLRFFPNPSANWLTIEYSNEDFTSFSVKVFNVLGQEIMFPPVALTAPFEAQRLMINVSDWANGAYFITLSDMDKKLTRKFIKMD